MDPAHPLCRAVWRLEAMCKENLMDGDGRIKANGCMCNEVGFSWFGFWQAQHVVAIEESGVWVGMNIL